MTYNCAQLLENTVKHIPKDLFNELIVVDDGSRDSVRAVAKKLKLKFFGHLHGGYGVNLRFGFQQAAKLGGNIFVEIHGDGQFDVSFFREAIKQIKSGSDLVLGDRFMNLQQALEDGMPLVRFAGNLALSLEGSLVLGLPNRELFTGSRAYSRKLVEKLHFNSACHADYFFSFEIIALAKDAGLTIGRLPTRSFYNQAHTSASLKYGLMHIYQVPVTLWFYFWAQRGYRRGIFQFSQSA